MIPFLLTLGVAATGLLGYIVWDLTKRVRQLEGEAKDHYHPTPWGPSGPPVDYRRALELLKEGKHHGRSEAN